MAFDDLADALHLATLLLQHGYIFPVIEHSLLVKDDNTLYRLQLPYFWPSHATHTDNVEYGKIFHWLLKDINDVDYRLI